MIAKPEIMTSFSFIITTHMNGKLIILIICGILSLSFHAYGEIIQEKDGFKWEKYGDYSEGWGAKDLHGNVIIPQKKNQSIFYSTAKYGTSLSIGYFRVETWNGQQNIHSLVDIKGNVILKPSAEDVGMGVKMCDNDTLVYLYSTNDKMDTWKAYTLEGKKLLDYKGNYTVDDQGQFIDSETKKILGKRLECSNGKLNNFYIPRPNEIIKTSMGDFFATEKHSDNFDWKLLTISDGSICGAVDSEDRIIVPVTNRAHFIKFNDGLFECRQEGHNGLAFVYDKEGNPIIPILDNNTGIVRTGNYFVGTTFDGDKDSYKSARLYSLNGAQLLPDGKFKHISVNHIGCPLHFYAEDFDGNLYIYGEDLTEELKIKNNEISFITKMNDDLGNYYLATMKDDRGESVIAPNGTSIIDAGKYTYIKRITTPDFSFYEACVQQKDKNGKPIYEKGSGVYKYGIVALNGEELIPPVYDLVTTYNNQIELTKDGKKYAVTADIKKTTKFENCVIDGKFYLVNEKGETLNKLGYDKLTFDEDKFSYLAIIGDFQSYINPSGMESNPIITQMFNKAYSMMATSPSEAIRQFNKIIELDKQELYPSILSQSHNNIGCLLFDSGDEDSAANHFEEAVRLMPSNQIAANNLNQIVNPQVEETSDESNLSGWDIASNMLGSIGNVINTFSYSAQGNHTATSDNSTFKSKRKVKNLQKTSTATKKGKSLSESQNERFARNTYNKNIDTLSHMAVFRQYYNDSVRRDIQRSMRNIRSRYGFPKSEWEDWDGSPK